MGHRLRFIHDPFHYGWVSWFWSFYIDRVLFLFNRITYSMGDVFLKPMMENFNSTEQAVSPIFGILPAITYGAGTTDPSP